MELIKRYIYAIERRLPKSGRDDIAKEIESIIMDELEGKYGAKATYSRDEIESVLLAMGHPRKVAARYRGDSGYLIGPDLFSFYWTVLWIVIGATAMGLIISYVIGYFEAEFTGMDAVLNFFEFIPSVISSVLSGIGAVTLIFILIERFGVKKHEKDFDINEGWKPRDLPELPQEKDKVSLAEPIVVITLLIIWAVFINTYARTGGVQFLAGLSDEITLLPIFNIEMVRQLLPLWNLQISVSLVLYLILMVQGKWRFGTRLLEIGSDLIGIAVLIMMINGPMLFSFNSLNAMMTEGVMPMTSIEMYYYIILKVILAIAILGIVVKTIKTIVRQARQMNV